MGGGFVALAIGLLAVAIAAPAEAGIIGEFPDDTGCFDRSLVAGSVDRVNDNVNSPLPPDDPELYPAPDAETGNFLHRSDIFTLDPECGYAELYGLAIVVKNPFDIDGPDDLNGASFPALSSAVDEDFPEFDHFTGISLPPPDVFDLNPAGFHGVSGCAFFGDDVGDANNMADCIAGTAARIPLFDLGALDPSVGAGMVFWLPTVVFGELGDFIAICDPNESEGECEGDSFELSLLIYSDVYGNTAGVYSHPEAIIGYNFGVVPTSVIPAVPEPSLWMLLGSGLAGLALRRRA